MDSSHALISTSDRLGFLTVSRHDGVRFNAQRKASGRVVLGTLTNGDFGIAPTINLFGLAFNFDGTPSGFIESKVGMLAAGQGLTSGQDAAFTLISKQFYESLTGIAIP
jgi:hypothetical protein